jgi:hypothetical protein
MSENAIETQQPGDWRPKVIAIGAVAGALVGAAAAYMLIQNSPEDAPPQISVREGIKIGLLVFGLLRSIASLYD